MRFLEYLYFKYSASHEYQHLQCETIQAMNMRQYKKLAASGMLTASFGFDDINETQLLLVTRRTAKPKYLFAPIPFGCVKNEEFV